MKKFSFLILSFFFAAISANGQDLWQQTNGPQAGSTNDMTVDSLQRIYVCTGGAGVYQSTDHGITWRARCKGLRTLPVRFIESSSAGNKVYLYALNHNNDVMRLRVDIEGAAWQYLNPDSGISTFIAFNGMMTNAKGYFYMATYRFGAIRSKDDGLTFERMDTNILDKTILVMTVDRKQNIYAASDSGWVFRSTNEGDTWERLPGQAPRGPFISAMVVADDGSICIGYHNHTEVYRSTNNGATWDSVFARDGAWIEHPDVDAMLHAVRGSDLIMNAHGPTYKSTDNGATWIAVDTTKRGDETFAIGGDSLGYLYQCAIPDGIFRSTDGGKNWEDINNTLNVQFFDGGIAINSKDILVGDSQFQLFRSEDDGDHWNVVGIELEEAFFPTLIFDHSDSLYLGLYNGLFRSADNGDKWTQILKEGGPFKVNQIYTVGVSPTNEVFVSSQMEGFTHSTDHGATLLPVFNFPTHIQVQAVGFGSKDTIIASGNSTDVYRSINNGVNWDIVSSDADASIKQFVWYRDGSIFRVKDVNFGIGDISRSQDGGKTWTKLFPPDTMYVRRIFTMMVDMEGKIVVCTDSNGVFRSKNVDFTEWENVSSGLYAPDFEPNRPINCSQIVQNKKGVYFAASRGASCYKSVPYLNSVSLPHGPLASTMTEPVNYPNPFSASTAINFTLPEAGNVSMEILDVLGRSIGMLKPGVMPAGEHTLAFSPKEPLPNGRYMVVIRCEGNVVSHWMVVTR